MDVKDATTLTARVTVPGDVPAGAYDVSVKQGHRERDLHRLPARHGEAEHADRDPGPCCARR